MTRASFALVIPLAIAFASMSAVAGWVGKKAPPLGQGEWINSAPTSLSALNGNVVLLEFWTYGCYNCRNTLPYVKEWHDKYSRQAFTVVGVHTPEFNSEKQIENVRRHVARLGIRYPVVTDNDYETWEAYDQRYWPVTYLIDKKGIIRYMHIGEGAYEETESMIQKLLSES